MSEYESIIPDVAGGIYDLVSVYDNAERVVFALKTSRNDVIEIAFSSPPMFNVMNESFGLFTINERNISEASGSLLYEVSGSAFLDFFHSQSYDMYRDSGIKHYVIMCMDDIVHIFADEPPVISQFPA